MAARVVSPMTSEARDLRNPAVRRRVQVDRTRVAPEPPCVPPEFFAIDVAFQRSSLGRSTAYTVAPQSSSWRSGPISAPRDRHLRSRRFSHSGCAMTARGVGEGGFSDSAGHPIVELLVEFAPAGLFPLGDGELAATRSLRPMTSKVSIPGWSLSARPSSSGRSFPLSVHTNR